MDKEKEITVHDLAKISGYSVATISRSLNDSPLVKEETKQKILKLAEDYHFELNASARGLATSLRPRLTIIHQPREKIAQTTCRRLIEKIGHTENHPTRIREVIRPHLVVRDTCRAPVR